MNFAPSKRIFLRAISLFTAALFLATNSSLPSARAEKGGPSSPEVRPIDLHSLSLPVERGEVIDTFQGRAGRTVILIQDAHSIPDAQRNIQRLVDYFREKYGVSLVTLEGAAHALDPQIFRSFPDKALLKKVFEEYHAKGELAGGVAASLFSKEGVRPAVFRGIEDWKLYEDGIRLYLEAAKKESGELKRIESKKQSLAIEKQKIYSAKLLLLDRAIEEFHENKIDFLEALARIAQFKKPPAGSDLAFLLEETERKDGDENANEGRLRAIKGTALFKHFESYMQETKEGLFRNAEERRLDGESQRLGLLERLIRLELTHEDWEKINQQNRGQVSELSAKDPSPVFRLQRAFYKNAVKREAAMFGNLAETMKGESGALLVAGGFHTEGLARRLREGGISYAVVMPRIDSVPEENFYRDQMRGEVSWKNYLRIENGRTSPYEAFVRATRDRLLNVGAQFIAPEGQRGVMNHAPTLIKPWRDQILRDLAAEGRLAEASRYTRFLDEVTYNLKPKTYNSLQSKAQRFIADLRRLEASGRLTQRNVFKLLAGGLQPSTVVSPLAGPGVLDFYATLGVVPEPPRAEVRTEPNEDDETFDKEMAGFLQNLDQQTPPKQIEPTSPVHSPPVPSVAAPNASRISENVESVKEEQGGEAVVEREEAAKPKEPTAPFRLRTLFSYPAFKTGLIAFLLGWWSKVIVTLIFSGAVSSGPFHPPLEIYQSPHSLVEIIGRLILAAIILPLLIIVAVLTGNVGVEYLHHHANSFTRLVVGIVVAVFLIKFNAMGRKPPPEGKKWVSRVKGFLWGAVFSQSLELFLAGRATDWIGLGYSGKPEASPFLIANFEDLVILAGSYSILAVGLWKSLRGIWLFFRGAQGEQGNDGAARSEARGTGQIKFSTVPPHVEFFDQDQTNIKLVVNTKAFNKAGESRLHFDRVHNKVLFDNQAEEFGKPGPSTALRKKTGDLMTMGGELGPGSVQAILPNGNLGYNAWFVGIADGKVFHYSEEPLHERRYDMLVVNDRDEIKIMTLKFMHKGKRGIFDLAGNEMGSQIKTGIYGQRIVKDGKENLDAVYNQFDDLRHLFRLPMFQFNADGRFVSSTEIISGLRQVHLGVSDGHGELYLDKEKIRRAVSGEPIALSIQPLLEKGVTPRQIKDAFNLWGYKERPDLSALNAGEFHLDEQANIIEVSLLPGIHPHSFMGLTKDGRIVAGVVPGETHFEGAELRKLAQELIALGLEDVFLWANGKDSFMQNADGESIQAKGARGGGIEAILVLRAEARAYELVEKEYRLEELLPPNALIEQVIIVADNTGTLTPDFQTPLQQGMKDRLFRFFTRSGARTDSEKYFLIVNSGDARAGIVKGHGPLIAKLAADPQASTYLSGYHFTTDGGKNRFGLGPGAQYSYDEQEPDWAVADRIARSQSIVNAFHDELKERIQQQDANLPPQLKGLTLEEIETARELALATVREKGSSEEKWLALPSGEIKNLVVYLLPVRFGKKVFIYDSGSKLAIESAQLPETEQFPFGFYQALEKRVRGDFGGEKAPFLTFTGTQFLDLAAQSKIDAVVRILDEHVFPGLDPTKPTLIISLGDGGNDIPTLGHPFESRPNTYHLPVFLSSQEGFAAALPPAAWISQKNKVVGAEAILDWVLTIQGQRAADVPPLKLRKWIPRSEARRDGTAPPRGTGLRRLAQSEAKLGLDSGPSETGLGGSAKSEARALEPPLKPHSDLIELLPKKKEILFTYEAALELASYQAGGRVGEYVLRVVNPEGGQRDLYHLHSSSSPEDVRLKNITFDEIDSFDQEGTYQPVRNTSEHSFVNSLCLFLFYHWDDNPFTDWAQVQINQGRRSFPRHYRVRFDYTAQFVYVQMNEGIYHRIPRSQPSNVHVIVGPTAQDKTRKPQWVETMNPNISSADIPLTPRGLVAAQLVGQRIRRILVILLRNLGVKMDLDEAALGNALQSPPPGLRSEARSLQIKSLGQELPPFDQIAMGQAKAHSLSFTDYEADENNRLRVRNNERRIAQFLEGLVLGTAYDETLKSILFLMLTGLVNSHLTYVNEIPGSLESLEFQPGNAFQDSGIKIRLVDPRESRHQGAPVYLDPFEIDKGLELLHGRADPFQLVRARAGEEGKTFKSLLDNKYPIAIETLAALFQIEDMISEVRPLLNQDLPLSFQPADPNDPILDFKFGFFAAAIRSGKIPIGFADGDTRYFGMPHLVEPILVTSYHLPKGILPRIGTDPSKPRAFLLLWPEDFKLTPGEKAIYEKVRALTSLKTPVELLSAALLEKLLQGKDEVEYWDGLLLLSDFKQKAKELISVLTDAEIEVVGHVAFRHDKLVGQGEIAFDFGMNALHARRNFRTLTPEETAIMEGQINRQWASAKKIVQRTQIFIGETHPEEFAHETEILQGLQELNKRFEAAKTILEPKAETRTGEAAVSPEKLPYDHGRIFRQAILGVVLGAPIYAFFVYGWAMRYVPALGPAPAELVQASLNQFLLSPLLFDPMNYIVGMLFIQRMDYQRVMQRVRKNLLSVFFLASMVWFPTVFLAMSFSDPIVTFLVLNTVALVWSVIYAIVINLKKINLLGTDRKVNPPARMDRRVLLREVLIGLALAAAFLFFSVYFYLPLVTPWVTQSGLHIIPGALPVSILSSIAGGYFAQRIERHLMKGVRGPEEEEEESEEGNKVNFLPFRVLQAVYNLPGFGIYVLSGLYWLYAGMIARLFYLFEPNLLLTAFVLGLAGKVWFAALLRSRSLMVPRSRLRFSPRSEARSWPEGLAYDAGEGERTLARLGRGPESWVTERQRTLLWHLARAIEESPDFFISGEVRAGRPISVTTVVPPGLNLAAEFPNRSFNDVSGLVQGLRKGETVRVYHSAEELRQFRETSRSSGPVRSETRAYRLPRRDFLKGVIAGGFFVSILALVGDTPISLTQVPKKSKPRPKPSPEDERLRQAMLAQAGRLQSQFDPADPFYEALGLYREKIREEENPFPDFLEGKKGVAVTEIFGGHIRSVQFNRATVRQLFSDRALKDPKLGLLANALLIKEAFYFFDTRKSVNYLLSTYYQHQLFEKYLKSLRKIPSEGEFDTKDPELVMLARQIFALDVDIEERGYRAMAAYLKKEGLGSREALERLMADHPDFAELISHTFLEKVGFLTTETEARARRYEAFNEFMRHHQEVFGKTTHGIAVQIVAQDEIEKGNVVLSPAGSPVSAKPEFLAFVKDRRFYEYPEYERAFQEGRLFAEILDDGALNFNFEEAPRSEPGPRSEVRADVPWASMPRTRQSLPRPGARAEAREKSKRPRLSRANFVDYVAQKNGLVSVEGLGRYFGMKQKEVRRILSRVIRLTSLQEESRKQADLWVPIVVVTEKRRQRLQAMFDFLESSGGFATLREIGEALDLPETVWSQRPLLFKGLDLGTILQDANHNQKIRGGVALEIEDVYERIRRSERAVLSAALQDLNGLASAEELAAALGVKAKTARDAATLARNRFKKIPWEEVNREREKAGLFPHYPRLVNGRTKNVLNGLARHLEERGGVSTIQEIALALGITEDAVYEFVSKLEGEYRDYWEYIQSVHKHKGLFPLTIFYKSKRGDPRWAKPLRLERNGFKGLRRGDDLYDLFNDARLYYTRRHKNFGFRSFRLITLPYFYNQFAPFLFQEKKRSFDEGQAALKFLQVALKLVIDNAPNGKIAFRPERPRQVPRAELVNDYFQVQVLRAVNISRQAIADFDVEGFQANLERVIKGKFPLAESIYPLTPKAEPGTRSEARNEPEGEEEDRGEFLYRDGDLEYWVVNGAELAYTNPRLREDLQELRRTDKRFRDNEGKFNEWLSADVNIIYVRWQGGIVGAQAVKRNLRGTRYEAVSTDIMVHPEVRRYTGKNLKIGTRLLEMTLDYLAREGAEIFEISISDKTNMKVQRFYRAFIQKMDTARVKVEAVYGSKVQPEIGMRPLKKLTVHLTQYQPHQLTRTEARSVQIISKTLGDVQIVGDIVNRDLVDNNGNTIRTIFQDPAVERSLVRLRDQLGYDTNRVYVLGNPHMINERYRAIPVGGIPVENRKDVFEMTGIRIPTDPEDGHVILFVRPDFYENTSPTDQRWAAAYSFGSLLIINQHPEYHQMIEEASGRQIRLTQNIATSALHFAQHILETHMVRILHEMGETDTAAWFVRDMMWLTEEMNLVGITTSLPGPMGLFLVLLLLLPLEPLRHTRYYVLIREELIRILGPENRGLLEKAEHLMELRTHEIPGPARNVARRAHAVVTLVLQGTAMDFPTFQAEFIEPVIRYDRLSRAEARQGEMASSLPAEGTVEGFLIRPDAGATSDVRALPSRAGLRRSAQSEMRIAMAGGDSALPSNEGQAGDFQVSPELIPLQLGDEMLTRFNQKYLAIKGEGEGLIERLKQGTPPVTKADLQAFMKEGVIDLMGTFGKNLEAALQEFVGLLQTEQQISNEKLSNNELLLDVPETELNTRGVVALGLILRALQSFHVIVNYVSNPLSETRGDYAHVFQTKVEELRKKYKGIKAEDRLNGSTGERNLQVMIPQASVMSEDEAKQDLKAVAVAVRLADELYGMGQIHKQDDGSYVLRINLKASVDDAAEAIPAQETDTVIPPFPPGTRPRASRSEARGMKDLVRNFERAVGPRYHFPEPGWLTPAFGDSNLFSSEQKSLEDFFGTAALTFAAIDFYWRRHSPEAQLGDIAQFSNQARDSKIFGSKELNDLYSKLYGTYQSFAAKQKFQSLKKRRLVVMLAGSLLLVNDFEGLEKFLGPFFERIALSSKGAKKTTPRKETPPDEKQLEQIKALSGLARPYLPRSARKKILSQLQVIFPHDTRYAIWGDAILHALVARRYWEKEGWEASYQELEARFSKLKSNEAFAGYLRAALRSQAPGLWEALKKWGRHNLGTLFETLVALIYLNNGEYPGAGFEAVERFVLDMMGYYLEEKAASKASGRSSELLPVVQDFIQSPRSEAGRGGMAPPRQTGPRSEARAEARGMKKIPSGGSVTVRLDKIVEAGGTLKISLGTTAALTFTVKRQGKKYVYGLRRDPDDSSFIGTAVQFISPTEWGPGQGLVRYILGREPEIRAPNILYVLHRGVSRYHADLIIQEEKKRGAVVKIIDRNSTNGTWVDEGLVEVEETADQVKVDEALQKMEWGEDENPPLADVIFQQMTWRDKIRHEWRRMRPLEQVLLGTALGLMALSLLLFIGHFLWPLLVGISFLPSLHRSQEPARPTASRAKARAEARIKEGDSIYNPYPELLALEDAWREFIESSPDDANKFQGAREGGAFVQSAFEWLERIKDEFNLGPTSRILDVGSGNGLAALAFHVLTGAEVISIEIDSQRWEVLQNFLKFLKGKKHQEYPKVRFEKADFLEFPLEGFSLIFFYFTYPQKYGESYGDLIVQRLDKFLPQGSVFVSPNFYLASDSRGSSRAKTTGRRKYFYKTRLAYRELYLPLNGIYSGESIVLSRAEARVTQGDEEEQLRRVIFRLSAELDQIRESHGAYQAPELRGGRIGTVNIEVGEPQEFENQDLPYYFSRPGLVRIHRDFLKVLENPEHLGLNPASDLEIAELIKETALQLEKTSGHQRGWKPQHWSPGFTQLVDAWRKATNHPELPEKIKAVPPTFQALPYKLVDNPDEARDRINGLAEKIAQEIEDGLISVYYTGQAVGHVSVRGGEIKIEKYTLGYQLVLYVGEEIQDRGHFDLMPGPENPLLIYQKGSDVMVEIVRRSEARSTEKRGVPENRFADLMRQAIAKEGEGTYVDFRDGKWSFWINQGFALEHQAEILAGVRQLREALFQEGRDLMNGDVSYVEMSKLKDFFLEEETIFILMAIGKMLGWWKFYPDPDDPQQAATVYAEWGDKRWLPTITDLNDEALGMKKRPLDLGLSYETINALVRRALEQKFDLIGYAEAPHESKEIYHLFLVNGSHLSDFTGVLFIHSEDYLRKPRFELWLGGKWILGAEFINAFIGIHRSIPFYINRIQEYLTQNFMKLLTADPPTNKTADKILREILATRRAEAREAAETVISTFVGANATRHKLWGVSGVIIRRGTGKAFIAYLERLANRTPSQPDYRARETSLIQSAWELFSEEGLTPEDLTLGFLFPETSVPGNVEPVAEVFARYAGDFGVDRAVISGRGDDLAAFRQNGIKIRPVGSFSRPLGDWESFLAVVVAGETGGRLNQKYLPISAAGIESIDDPLLRDHIRFLQIYTAGVAAALLGKDEFQSRPALLKDKLMSLLSRAGYGNILKEQGLGFNVSPLEVELASWAATEDALVVSA